MNQQDILDQALKENRAVMLDWKFSAEDVVFNLKQILPNLNIESLGEKQSLGDWIESIKIDDTTYDFKPEPAIMLDEIFQKVNLHLKGSQLFVTQEISDDNHYFLLINKDHLPEFEQLSFRLP